MSTATRVAGNRFRGSKRRNSGTIVFPSDAGKANKRPFNHQQGDPDFQLEASIKHYLNDLFETVQTEMNAEQLETLVQRAVDECGNCELAVMSNDEAGRQLVHILCCIPEMGLQWLSRVLRTNRAALIRCVEGTAGSRNVELLLACCFRGRLACLAQQRHLLTEVGEFVLKNFDAFCSQLFPAFLVRSVARLIVGLPLKIEDSLPKNEQLSRTGFLDDEEVKTLYESMLSKCLNWDYIKEYLNTESLSILVQEFYALDVEQSSGVFAKALADEILQEKGQQLVYNQLFHTQACRFWELFVKTAELADVEKFYEKFMQGQMVHLAVNRCANFIVQRLVERLAKSELKRPLFAELLTLLGKVWNSKRYGILVSMCALVDGDESMEVQYFQTLSSCLRYSEETAARGQLILSVLNLMPCKKLSDNFQPKYFGSVIAQKMLRWTAATELMVNSTIGLHAEELLKIGTDQYGSHYLEAFVRAAPPVALKSVFGLCKDHLLTMAMDSRGSPIVEALLQCCDQDDRACIMQTLADGRDQLERSKPGHILALKYSLSIFSKSPSHWLRLWDRRTAKRTKFDEIVNLKVS